MSVDMRARRMPGPVMTAAILLGGFGGLAGLGLAALGALQMEMASTAPVLVAMGLLLAMFSGFAVWGLTRGDRGSQIVAMIVGALMAFGGLAGVSQGQLISVLWFAVGVAIVLLVLAPVSSREWFAH